MNHNIITNSDFEQIQKDLELFKNHTPMQETDSARLMGYLDRLGRLIADENYSELEYIAECFMCAIRDIMANVKQKSKKEILIKCADSMGNKIYVMKYTSINDEDEPENTEEIQGETDSISDEKFETDVERGIVEGSSDMPLRITLSRTTPIISEIENQEFRNSKIQTCENQKEIIINIIILILTISILSYPIRIKRKMILRNENSMRN